MTVSHSWGEAVGGPGDPQNLQQVALGVPFQVFPVVGKGSGRPCISNLSKKKKKKTLEKKKPAGPEWLSEAWLQI